MSVRTDRERFLPLAVFALAAFLAAGLLVSGLLGISGCAPEAETSQTVFDVVIVGGAVYDGTGSPPVDADIGIVGDRIVEIGDLEHREHRRRIDASGLAVAPGFVNMLSWATESLLVDGRSLGDLRQGVTLEVFGEGMSMGPLNDTMKERMREAQQEAQYEIDWTTLGEYLESLERRGIVPNVASFVGATTVRIHELGHDNREPDAQELERMQDLVRQAMAEGALGVGSSLIYAPAFYSSTEELTALLEAAGESGGRYITHMRSEGDQLLEALDEFFAIVEGAAVGGEIYHLKQGGRRNWPMLDAVIERIEAARAEGLDVGANMYTYTAGSTGLDAAMPPAVQEGGLAAWIERLEDPQTRRAVEEAMRLPGDGWENLYEAAGPEGVMLVGFRNPELRRAYTGKTIAEVAQLRGVTPEAAAIDLVIEDGTRVESVYFLMSEDNVRRQIQLPWVSFGSDAASMAPEGVFLSNSTHPRAYGNFARLLGRYVRDEGLITLAEAVRRLTTLSMEQLGLAGIVDRGQLAPGFFADVVVFDPQRVEDHATFEDPHQLASGVLHVLVNGEVALLDGEATGVFSGRVVRGPGYRAPGGAAGETP